MKRPRQSRLRRKLLMVVVAYVLLLIISTAVRDIAKQPHLTVSGQEAITVPTFTAQGPVEGTASRLAYWESGPEDGPVVIMLHGSPVPSPAMRPLMQSFQHLATYRVILPDLPGFGGSTHNVPDYSTHAHAHAVLALMDDLGVDQAHILAYSQGGGVLINMAQLQPERIASATLVASIGVIELELLGNYTLNRGLYAFQQGALWVLTELTPHFGLLDRLPFPVESYTRNFSDTDMRPFRAILEQIEMPVMIVHGKDDSLVPLAAALEHHRIVPQSELVVLDGNHLTPIYEAERVAVHAVNFIARVEAGKGVRRAGAHPERITSAGESFDEQTFAMSDGLALVFLIVLIALATLVSEDLTCIGTGFLVASGAIAFHWGVLACYLGILVGDVAIYCAGRWFGHPLLRSRALRWLINPRAVRASERWFAKQGMKIIISSRFLPGTRLPTYFAAGALRTRPAEFLCYFMISVALWTPLLVGIATLIGERLLPYMDAYNRFGLITVIVTLIAVVLTVRFAISVSTWGGRRRLVGWWKRKYMWEYWPLWRLYLPVFFHIAGLMFRYRSPTLFAASNPGIPTGGLIGESKAQILSNFGNHPTIARWTLLREPQTTGTQELDAWIRATGQTFPIVLKPDQGQRGLGIAIASDRKSAREYLRHAPLPVIAQEYIGGEEFGVFYVRFPSSEKGRVVSLTWKQPCTVTGNGKSTLQKLILADKRAVAKAPYFLKVHAENLMDRIPAGETYTLAEAGTHAKGSIFLDANAHITPELTAAIEDAAQAFDGFYFGRFDVRVPSLDDLKAGHNLHILECNGVTSEMTHIYDSKHTVAFGRRILCRQWSLAFAIGEENRRLHGVEPETPRALLAAILEARKLQARVAMHA